MELCGLVDLGLMDLILDLFDFFRDSQKEISLGKSATNKIFVSIPSNINMKKNFQCATICSGGVVRLSISPSQGEDHGFKSRPEH